MKKLHVLSKRVSNDNWELVDINFDIKAINIQIDTLIKSGLTRKQLKVEHFEKSKELYAYKLTCYLIVKDNQAHVHTICIANDLLKSLECSDNCDKKTRIKYNDISNIITIFIYATNEVNALQKSTSIIESKLFIINSKHKDYVIE